MFVAERAETSGHTIDGHSVVVGLRIEEVTTLGYFGDSLLRKLQSGAIFQYFLNQVVGELT